TIPAEKVHIFPWIGLSDVSLIHAEIELAMDAVLPREPFHDAVSDWSVVNHVVWPSCEVVAPPDETPVAATGLVPPQVFPLRKLWIVCTTVGHRITEGRMIRFR